MKRPIEIKGVIIIEIILAVAAIPSGIILILDPSGRSLGIDFLLDYLPLIDFTPVGLWLFFVFGILPIILAVGLWLTKFWSWFVAVILAIVEIIWIAIQIVLLYEIGLSPLQALVAGFGVATIFLLFMPASRHYVSLRRISAESGET